MLILPPIQGQMEDNLRLQKAIPVSIDQRHSRIIGNGNMLRRNANKLAILLVGSVDGQKALTLARLQEQPQIGKRSQTRGRDVVEAPLLQIRKQEVNSQQAAKQVGGGFDGNQHDEAGLEENLSMHDTEMDLGPRIVGRRVDHRAGKCECSQADSSPKCMGGLYIGRIKTEGSIHGGVNMRIWRYLWGGDQEAACTVTPRSNRPGRKSVCAVWGWRVWSAGHAARATACRLLPNALANQGAVIATTSDHADGST